MNIRRIHNFTCLYFFAFSVIFLNGCGMNYYEALDKEYKKFPNHLDNVPPSDFTALDGVWFNPSVGKQVSIIAGREIDFIRITPQDPMYPAVLVKEIKLVAPGRYRGVPMVMANKFTHVTYSIISENKLLTRWHNKTGEKQDVVYDKVKLTFEQRYLNEYNEFLKETQGTPQTAQAQKTAEQISQPNEELDSSNIQITKGGLVSKVLIHKIYTEPSQITPGIKFKFFVDYTVSDTSVNTTDLPVVFNLEILKSNTPSQVSVKSIADNTILVHAFEPVTMNCNNGKRSIKAVHLTAANEKGSYYLAARLTYNEQTTTSYHFFTLR